MQKTLAAVALAALFALHVLPLQAQESGLKRPAGGRATILEKAAEKTMQPLINIVAKWIFPAVAFAAALYGIVRGIKRGEWDFAVICLLASISLALLPTVLGELFF